jgi:nucleotide-binding universal stress UspA family protein
MSDRYTVLVPVDGSATSLRALSLACERAGARPGAIVVVLNVQPPMPEIHGTRAEAQAIRDFHSRNFAEVFQKVANVTKRAKVRVQQEMRIGLPAHVIAQQAIRHQADEIVMGTRGQGKIKALIMGSVAMKVMQLSKVPVTLVK